MIATLAVYWQVHRFNFVNLDDNVYVTENHHIPSGFTADGVAWAFTTKYFYFWNPLLWYHHDEAIRLKPDYAEAYYNRGTTDASLGRYQQALEDFDRAIRLHP